jgi:hypothetical protein
MVIFKLESSVLWFDIMLKALKAYKNKIICFIYDRIFKKFLKQKKVQNQIQLYLVLLN